MAQKKNNYYTAAWKRIDSLIEKTGLLKSALKEIEAVYVVAAKEANNGQLIRALIYKLKVNDQLYDDSELQNFALLQKEIRSVPEPAKSILISIAASSYERYLLQNRYKFSDRTNTIHVEKNDIATYGIADLEQVIDSLYTSSLNAADALKKTRVSSYNPILIHGNATDLRPTLFDLLSHRALRYYTANESTYRKADSIFNELTRFHSNDKTPDALIDLKIEEIAYQNRKSSSAINERQYKESLEKLIDKYPTHLVATRAYYMLAQWYVDKAAGYDPLGDTTARYENLKALQTCEQATRIPGEAQGKANCINLATSIRQKYINMQVEKVNSIEKPFRALLTYKNTTSAYFRIIKLNKAIKKQIPNESWENSFWQQLLQLPVIKKFDYALPDTKDYQQHRVEIKVDALASGEYALIASANRDFDLEENALTVNYFYVSDIAYVNSGRKYYVVDRNSGAPLYKAFVQVMESKYDYRAKKQVLYKIKDYRTDQFGRFEFGDSSTASRSVRFDISHGKDRLFVDDNEFYFYYQGRPEKMKDQTFLFTDRSIYRPGQIVHFKGILVDPNTKKVIANQKRKIKLTNANGQTADSVELTSNEFGSFSGRFTFPSGVLNGNFSITDIANQTSVNFNVEEYKRPKFFVEIKKPGGTYRLGDTINVESVATAYAGNIINGAAFKYRVVRRSIMPFFGDQLYSYSARIWPPVRSRAVEIAQGEGTTNDSGRINIQFPALPDSTINSTFNPVFHYEVSIDVTDLNGETRTGSEYIAVGYKSLKLAIDIPAKLPADSLKRLTIITSNNNDVFEPSRVVVNVFSLESPAREFRKRYWPQPDQFIMSREDYYRKFPFDAYADEEDVTKWKRDKKVFSKEYQTAADTSFKLTEIRFKKGWYAVEAITKDKFGQEVKETKYIELSDPRSAAMITYTDRSELPTSRFFVKNNRVYIHDIALQLPEEEHKIVIHYTSFRDKILPGSVEKWKLKLTGFKGQSIVAEVLASMYDASLDQFNAHSWQIPSLYYNELNTQKWTDANNFESVSAIQRIFDKPWVDVPALEYDRLRTEEYDHLNYALRGRTSGIVVQKSAAPAAVARNGETFDEKKEASNEADAALPAPPPARHSQIRTNLNETAFFLPELRTDSNGNLEFSFTGPEAVTEWKWMVLAHSKDVSVGYDQKKIITKKDLMVQPNIPRFLRQGDRIALSAKIANLTNKEITGKAALELFDPATGQTLDGLFHNISPTQFFTVAGLQSGAINFSIEVPYNIFMPLGYRIFAVSGNMTDGEEGIIPITTNKVLVTESMPLHMRGNGTKNFDFNKLINSNHSETLQHSSLKVEYTANPAWYAIQALPYLNESARENSEQLFNLLYASAVAEKIAKASPRIRNIISTWKLKDTAALLSNLEKNPELKSLLLSETPWVLDAKNETQRKRNLALLFDLSKMSSQLDQAIVQLQALQLPSGGFTWYPGGRENRYISQYILSGIGHLKKIGALPSNNKIDLLIKAGLGYLDEAAKKEYEDILKLNKKIAPGAVSEYAIHYLYVRSFFPETPVRNNALAAFNYYQKDSKTGWLKYNSYLRGMIALSLFRSGDAETSKKIMAALKETSLTHAELGRYWKDQTGGYYWYQAPIETQSLLIEAFAEINKDMSMVADMKTWLLKNKQTNNWSTTKATADACYALLLQGSDWINKIPDVAVALGNKQVEWNTEEAGTGYLTSTIDAGSIKPEMGKVKLTVSKNEADAPSWGAVYWQYFDNLDNITPASTPLSIEKKLFIQKLTAKGPVLEPLNDMNTLHIGDKVIVRIELRTDRDMEYLHMKDMRGSCMEPVNVLSAYKWQGGLGYYESTKDVSTDFFFEYLRKGVYVFEYPLFVSQEGTFTNGITSIRCMYAPEFSSHSGGIKLNVERK